jgi:hypothetical protein
MVEEKAISELRQVHHELSMIKKAIFAYVESQGVDIPGYSEPARSGEQGESRKNVKREPQSMVAEH